MAEGFISSFSTLIGHHWTPKRATPAKKKLEPIQT